MNRAALRETVFKVLFRYEFHDVESFKNQINLFFSEYPENSDEDEEWPELNEESVLSITDKVTDILSKLDEIDAKIEANCIGWKFDRIGKAELSILRVAVYEIMYDEETDTPVSISEAVKMSKKYCDEKTHAFVNGLLAKFTK